jgi:bacterioferritin
MQGSEEVINEVNRALSAELTAVVQYMVRAEMCETWGYGKLSGGPRKRAIEEMHHAEGQIERVLFL